MRRVYKHGGSDFLQQSLSGRTRGNGFKLKEGRFRLDVGKTFFIQRAVRCWHRLPREVVDAQPLEAFMARLDVILHSLI